MPTDPSDPYRDHALYDLEYADYDEDIKHYVGLARASKGPVLELACGTGRLTLPIARAGVTITGVDLSETMLDGLRDRLELAPMVLQMRVQVRQGDYRSWRPRCRYPLVMLPFNAIHHCMGPDEVLAMLAVVRSALAAGGVFALDCYLPDDVLYERDPERRYEERTFVDPRTGGALLSWEQGWWDKEARIHHVTYYYQQRDGSVERAHLRLRMYTRDELLALIDQAGFELLEEAKDFERSPVSGQVLKWVLLLRARAAPTQ